MHQSTETYLDWFILREIPGLGCRSIKRLIRIFKSPGAVLKAGASALGAVQGIGKKQIKAIGRHETVKDAARSELDRVRQKGYRIRVLTDPGYPELLAVIPDPPPILTFIGRLNPDLPCIAVVGSRKATQYGLNTAGNLSARLARSGFQVVSGMAVGIDAMAHEGALREGKPTLAVLGSGLNRVYPRQNQRLFQRITRYGGVCSEFRVDEKPTPANFPIRNRIIAGLSCGTLVVEAEKRSGSLITARLSGEYNREVFAVPGSIASSRSHGTHTLLKQGARLVENEMDIIDELGHFVHASPAEPSTPEPKTGPDKTGPVAKLLEPYPVHMDVLVEKSGLDSARVSADLLELELAGWARRHAGNYYSLAEEDH